MTRRRAFWLARWASFWALLAGLLVLLVIAAGRLAVAVGLAAP